MNTQRRRIIPEPRSIEFGKETLRLELMNSMNISDNISDDTAKLMQHLWHGFSFNQGKLEIVRDSSLSEFAFRIGNCAMPENCDGDLYEVKGDTTGVAGRGRNEQAMLYSYYAFLQMINSNNDTLEITYLLIPEFEIHDTTDIKFRGIHICVFPETSFEILERYLKTIAFLKFSHVIVEFWGMLKYDCMNELSWPQAFTKEQVRPLLKEISDMGVELIPMFNHWGHAAATRVKFGRHVVLNQNPKFAPLFECDGWTWCLSNPYVKTLLKDVRSELIKLFRDCGHINYFCLGGDEAFSHGECDNCSKTEKGELLAGFFNSINEDLKTEDIRPIIWGDPLLDRDQFSAPYVATGHAGGTPKALDMLSRDFIIGDWQYFIENGEDDTFRYFKEKGFDVLAAPWDKGNNIKTICDSTRKLNLSGVIFTTWNTISPNLLQMCSLNSWQGDTSEAYTYSPSGLNMIAQKLTGHKQAYEFAGWSSKEYHDSES